MPLRPIAAAAAVTLAAVTLAACSPTYNWRQLRLDGTPLQALMPCKAESAARPVPLGTPTAGAPAAGAQPAVAAPAATAAATLTMHSCQAGGLTFAVAWVALPDGSDAAAALDQWRLGALTTIQGTPDAAPFVPRIKGAPDAQGLRARGRTPDGRDVVMQAVYARRGGQLYQGAIYGPAIPDEVSTTFFDGLSLP